ncbi:alpha/beta hydrolase [Amycolatopsis sp. NPDC051372]|uniref:alpha/beta fold hydrolase n=1 Tax=unclassified Amycolatopsis TaxID=2618356 RepID=UPI00342E27B2
MALRKITLGGLSFDVSDTGPEEAPAVLLLHGFPQSFHCWDGVAQRLNSQGYRTIAPNQRGYSAGARPLSVSDYGVPALVADALGILDSLGVAQAHIAGHDWGGILAWHLAVQHPERARSLVAVSMPHPAAWEWARENDPDQQHSSRYLAEFRREGEIDEVIAAGGKLRALMVPPLSDEQFAPHQALMSGGAATPALNWYRAMGSFRALGPSTVPTTYLWSTADTALGRTGAERCRRHVTGPYRFVELEGITHWVPETAPDAVAREILTAAEQN